MWITCGKPDVNLQYLTTYSLRYAFMQNNYSVYPQSNQKNNNNLSTVSTWGNCGEVVGNLSFQHIVHKLNFGFLY